MVKRKLRLDIGDFVYFKPYEGIGKIIGRELLPKSENSNWGVWSYRIAWLEENLGIETENWTIRDITIGNLLYIGNRADTIKVLYERG